MIEDIDPRKGQFKLILIILSTISILMIGFTIIWEINYYNDYGFFKKSIAVVIDHEEVQGKLYNVLKYNAEGVTYYCTSEKESTNNIGDEITIYYDENNPTGHIYSLDNRRILLPLISSLFLFINIGLIVYYNLKYNKIKKED